MGRAWAQPARTRMSLLALPQVMVTLQPLTVVSIALTWAVISRSAVTNASTAPTSAPGTTNATTVSLLMTAQTRLRADGEDVWFTGESVPSYVCEPCDIPTGSLRAATSPLAPVARTQRCGAYVSQS